MQFETITTKRLILRIVTPEVCDYVFNHYSDKEIMALFNLKNSEELSKEKEKYQIGIATYNRSFVHFYMIDRLSEMIIGWCGYHIWYTDHARAEIGYIIKAESFKQKGLISEALDAILPYGFKVMGLHRIEAFVGVNNNTSRHLLEKRGYNYEGRLKDHYLKEGVFEDSLVFSLLKTDLIRANEA